MSDEQQGNETTDFNEIFEGYDAFDQDMAKSMKRGKKRSTVAQDNKAAPKTAGAGKLGGMAAHPRGAGGNSHAPNKTVKSEGEGQNDFRKSFPVQDPGNYSAVHYVGAPIFTEFEKFHGGQK